MWMTLLKEGHHRLIRIDRKGNSSSRAPKSPKQKKMAAFVLKLTEKLSKDRTRKTKTFEFIEGPKKKRGLVIFLQHHSRLIGYAFLYPLGRDRRDLRVISQLFCQFFFSQIELAYKNFELNNFYETVHPRALALSTMHSVHRVISSSLRLQDLLPRIGRLSAQVLKAQGCSIMLVDPEHEYLIPYFSVGHHSRFVHAQRIRIGRGLQGQMAETGDFHLSRRSIGVPFIEDDVVGIICLWDKIEGHSFTKIDLEILKSLSEQAVVAIKNARLFEETEQLTLGSIKTINELLELNFGGDRSQLPVFHEIVMEMAKALELNTRERVHLERAILLLDTGALALPDKLLYKKGKLTKKEFAQIKRIPSRGANLLRSISSLQPIIPIILHQHERYDGKGYPQGLAKDEIPIGARIVSVVNSFVAMVSKRSYREQLSVEVALKEIASNRGTQFDPRVVDCFMAVVKRREMLQKLKTVAGNVRPSMLNDLRREN